MAPQCGNSLGLLHFLLDETRPPMLTSLLGFRSSYRNLIMGKAYREKKLGPEPCNIKKKKQQTLQWQARGPTKCLREAEESKFTGLGCVKKEDMQNAASQLDLEIPGVRERR